MLRFLHHITWLVEVKESLFYMLLSPSAMTNFDVMEITSMLQIKYAQFDAIYYTSDYGRVSEGFLKAEPTGNTSDSK